MSKEIKGDHKHLTLFDRIYIEQALDRGDNFRTIAKFIGKDPTTISLEVRRFLEWHDGLYAREVKNDCAHYSSCDMEFLCMTDCPGYCRDCRMGSCHNHCKHYEPLICYDLKVPPYVCNSCKAQETCRAAKYY